MKTECTQKSFAFHALGRRDVVARFDGGHITSDAGGLLLREVDERTGILARFAKCFEDHRDPELIEHSVRELVSQRVYALALGYEDLNDHDELRHDPLLAVLVGKADPLGMDRPLPRDRGKACAGKSTLNRLELTPVGATAASRYKKIVAHQGAIERLFLDVFLKSHRQPPRQIVLDLDATDDPVHGHQLGRFFHGYYGHYGMGRRAVRYDSPEAVDNRCPSAGFGAQSLAVALGSISLSSDLRGGVPKLAEAAGRTCRLIINTPTSRARHESPTIRSLLRVNAPNVARNRPSRPLTADNPPKNIKDPRQARPAQKIASNHTAL